MDTRWCHRLLTLLVVSAGLQATAHAGTGIEPNAGNWQTWVISSGHDYRVPPPPDAAETESELRAHDTLFTFRAFLRTTFDRPGCYIRDSQMINDYAGAFDYDNPDGYGNTLLVNGREYRGQEVTR